MPRYRVLRDYGSPRVNGREGARWKAGDVIERDAADAEWVNRDSSGTLEAFDGKTADVKWNPEPPPAPSDAPSVVEAPPRRGRPPGSKNKPREA